MAEDTGHQTLGHSVAFAAATKSRYYELLKYPNLEDVQRIEGELDDASLPAWLSRDLSFSLPSNQAIQLPSGGLRLLIGTYDLTRPKNPIFPFKAETFAAIEQHLGLPWVFLKQATSIITLAFRFCKQRQSERPLRGLVFKVHFKRGRLLYQFALIYNIKTRITQGILIYRTPQSELPSLLEELQRHEGLCEQPLLLPVVSSENIVDVCQERLKQTEVKLKGLEALMGQHEYKNRPQRNPLDIDFLAATRTLNYVSKKVAKDIMRLGSLIGVLQKIREFKKDIDRDELEESGRIPNSETVEMGPRVMDEKIEYLMDNCRALVAVAEYQQKRAATLIQVVYQFMAQKDAKVNIALAESSTTIAKASKEDSAVMRSMALESKKDSSAMKTIAILGMFFLPGTFVAAIFAMPVFNWDGIGDHTPVVKTAFKYYWAVTVPLTVLVFTVWAFAMLFPWRRWLAVLGVASQI